AKVLSSKSVTSAATSSITSLTGSSPVISRSIHKIFVGLAFFPVTMGYYSRLFALLFGRVFRGLKIERHGVNAKTHAGRCLRRVMKDVPQMAITDSTADFYAVHAVRCIFHELDILFVFELVKARPARV